MNLVGYGRVSTESQRDNTSLETQKEAIIRFCEQFGHRLVGYYEDVESAATIEKRENFQWALQTVAAVADGLLVYRLDRLTRSVLDGERLKEALNKQGKILLSVNDNIDLATDDGQFVFTIGSAVAQLERKRIRARSMAGRERKKADGGYHAGRAPFGYISFRGCLMVHPPEQEVIKLIRRLHGERGFGYAAIARWLNSEGIPAKGGVGRWGTTSIARIVNGDPPIAIALEASGKLLPASEWEKRYGTKRDTSESPVDPTRDEAAS